MKLKLVREIKTDTYTIGRLYIDDQYICDTLEDKERDLDVEEKIMNETAIPKGTYELIISYSPKFRRKLPELLNVPYFTGIRIHRGNTDEDTSGCILVGFYKGDGRIAFSTQCEKKVMNILFPSNESHSIEIL